MTINTQLVYSAENDHLYERIQMVESQLVARDIENPNIIKAMRAVPRHLFVSPAHQEFAYEDCPLSIACGQTISQPYMVAKAAELLDLTGEEKVLEVGAGSGYQAAVLSFLAKRVVGLEYHQELAQQAKQTLKELHIKNVSIHHADGKLGWVKEAPYDRILCSCSVTSLPSAWKEQLKEGGVLLFPRGTGTTQVLSKWTKEDDGWIKEDILGVRYVPLL
jgi:protein-L-isoaspartate(D-aspartate) O-methyltransferase